MIVKEYADKEVKALKGISQKLSYGIAQFIRILGPGYSDTHDNVDVAIRSYQASSRELKALKETADLGYSKIVWLRNEKGIIRCFRITSGPSMVLEQNLHFVGSTVERYFGGQDVYIGETKSVDLEKGEGIIKRNWTLVARAILKNCQLNLRTPEKADIDVSLYENTELKFQLNKLRKYVQSGYPDSQYEIHKLEKLPRTPTFNEKPIVSRGLQYNWWPTDMEILDEENEFAHLENWVLTNTTSKQRFLRDKTKGLVVAKGIAGSGKSIFALGRLRYLKNIYLGAQVSDLDPHERQLLDPSKMTGFVKSHNFMHYLVASARDLELSDINITIFNDYRLRTYAKRKIHVNSHLLDIYSSSKSWITCLQQFEGAFLCGLRRFLFDAIDNSGVDDFMDNSGLKIKDQLANLGAIKNVIKEISENTLFNSNSQSMFISMHLFQRLDKKLSQHQNLILRVLNITPDERDIQREMNKLMQDSNKDRQRNNYYMGQEGENISEFKKQAKLNAVAEATQRKKLAADEIANSFHEFIGMHLSKTNLTDLIFHGLETDSELDIHNGEMASEFESSLNRCENIILCLYSMITRGSKIGRKNSPWENMALSSAVFIDEFEDFYPEEILLLSMEASPELNCVTISGDDLQDTKRGDIDGNKEFFALWKKKEEIFLDKNFRQRGFIGLVTTALRSAIMGEIIDFDDSDKIPFFTPETISLAIEDITHLLNSIPKGASVAIILADTESKEIWYARLKQVQSSINRELSLSDERDLISRLPLHFTTVEDVKGLQFNAVLIPDLERYSTIEKHLYIAMTRAKDALYLASEKNPYLGVCVGKLIEAGAIYEEKSPPRSIEF